MSSPRSVVLMYHRVTDATSDLEEGDYALPTGLFEAHARWLARSGRPALPLRTLLAGDRPTDSVVLTFDDGFETDATVAAPLLSALGLPATFFVTPSWLGRPGHLSSTQLRALGEAGFEIGAHGLDHRLLGGLEEAEIRRQLVESKGHLEDLLGARVESLSLPGGSGGRRVLGVAREVGFRLVLGSRPGAVRGTDTASVLPRFALRRHHGLATLRAAVEQHAGFRLRQGLRYRLTRLGRTLIGESSYAGLRRWRLRGAERPSARPGS